MPEAHAVFVAEVEERRAEWPADWALGCGDEATVRRQPTRTAQGYLVADIPEVPTGDDQAKVQGDGAVAPWTGRTHDPSSPKLGKGQVAQCLPHLLTGYPRQRLLGIHDRGEQQKGAPIEAISREAGDRRRWKPQPAYSPELNPQARSGTWLRRLVTPTHWCATLQEHIEAIRHGFRDLAGVKAQVRPLCGFKTPDSLVASL
jgi:hypothetical protein